MAVAPQLQQNVLAVLKPEFQKRNFGLFKSLEEYGICRAAGKCLCYDTPAVRRVMAQDVAGIKQYLEWGLDLQHFTHGGCSLLGLIMRSHSLEMTEYLFSNGHIKKEDIFTVTSLGNDVVTLGDAVVLGGCSDNAMRFVDIAGPDTVASLSKVSMFEAFRRLSAPALKRLIEVGLPLTIREDITNNTVLHVALDNEDASAVLELILPLTLQLCNETNADNETVLGRAITLPSMDAVRTLIKVDGISPSSNGRRLSPLYIAASTRDVKMVPLLIKNGADPNDGRGTLEGTALHVAVGNLGTDIYDSKAWRVFNSILENGGDMEAPNLYGTTPRSLMNRVVSWDLRCRSYYR